MTKFCTRLQAVLDERGLTPDAFARMLFNNETYVRETTGEVITRGKGQVYKYLNGSVIPTKPRYRLILSTLGLTANDLPLSKSKPRRKSMTDENQLKLDLPTTNKRANMRDLVAALNRLTDAVNKLAN